MGKPFTNSGYPSGLSFGTRKRSWSLISAAAALLLTKVRIRHDRLAFLVILGHTKAIMVSHLCRLDTHQ